MKKLTRQDYIQGVHEVYQDNKKTQSHQVELFDLSKETMVSNFGCTINQLIEWLEKNKLPRSMDHVRDILNESHKNGQLIRVDVKGVAKYGVR